MSYLSPLARSWVLGMPNSNPTRSPTAGPTSSWGFWRRFWTDPSTKYAAKPCRWPIVLTAVVPGPLPQLLDEVWALTCKPPPGAAVSEFIDLDCPAPAPGGSLRSTLPPPVFSEDQPPEKPLRRYLRYSPAGPGVVDPLEIWYLLKIVSRMDNRAFYTNTRVGVSCGFVLPVDVHFNTRVSLLLAATEQEYFFEHFLRDEKDSKLEAEASPIS